MPVLDPNGEQVNTNGGPWWAKLINSVGWQAALILGLVGFLMYQQTTGIQQLSAAQAATHATVVAQSALIQQQTTAGVELRGTLDAIRRILSASCANEAKDNAARNACFQ